VVGARQFLDQVFDDAEAAVGEDVVDRDRRDQVGFAREGRLQPLAGDLAGVAVAAVDDFAEGRLATSSAATATYGVNGIIASSGKPPSRPRSLTTVQAPTGTTAIQIHQ
jgi:hypothetical protein